MTDIVTRAAQFAAKAHGAQTRKWTNELYIVHPAAVAELVRSVPHTPEMLAAAWLHDVAEDCDVTIEQLEAEFGSTVASLVDQLTDISRPAHGNRAARKAIDRMHLAAASPEAQTIKLADLIDNAASIVGHDPAFAAVYIPETAALLQVLTRGDPTLMAMAREYIAA